MLGVVFFLFSQFLPIEIIVYDRKLLYPIENINFWRFENCQIYHILY